MKSIDKLHSRLRAGLAAVYRSKGAGAGPLDDRWQQNVMRSVRQIGPIRKNIAELLGFGRLVWRLAPAALFLMIILAVLIVRTDKTLELQIASRMVGEPVHTYMNYEAL